MISHNVVGELLAVGVTKTDKDLRFFFWLNFTNIGGRNEFSSSQLVVFSKLLCPTVTVNLSLHFQNMVSRLYIFVMTRNVTWVQLIPNWTSAIEVVRGRSLLGLRGMLRWCVSVAPWCRSGEARRARRSWWRSVRRRRCSNTCCSSATTGRWPTRRNSTSTSPSRPRCVPPPRSSPPVPSRLNQYEPFSSEVRPPRPPAPLPSRPVSTSTSPSRPRCVPSPAPDLPSPPVPSRLNQYEPFSPEVRPLPPPSPPIPVHGLPRDSHLASLPLNINSPDVMSHRAQETETVLVSHLQRSTCLPGGCTDLLHCM